MVIEQNMKMWFQISLEAWLCYSGESQIQTAGYTPDTTIGAEYSVEENA